MKAISKLTSATPNGVYTWHGSLTALSSAAQKTQHFFCAIDLTGVKEKTALLQRLQNDLRFPNHFGQNWDALLDCLCDLAWHPATGYLIVIINPGLLNKTAPHTWQTLQEICTEAAEFWSKEGKPFRVFFIEQASD